VRAEQGRCWPEVGGWFLPEQPTGPDRAARRRRPRSAHRLLVWPDNTAARRCRHGAGQPGPSSGRGRRHTYGPSVVQSALWLRDAAQLERTGPVQPYLCHGICELGSTAWEPAMEEVRAWLDAHPREVVKFFIQDEVSPADTAAVFEEAGYDRGDLFAVVDRLNGLG
jgi:hypothetical protein